MKVGTSPDGSIVIRGDKQQLDKLIQAIRDAVLYGEGIVQVHREEGTVKIRVFKDPMIF